MRPAQEMDAQQALCQAMLGSASSPCPKAMSAPGTDLTAARCALRATQTRGSFAGGYQLRNLKAESFIVQVLQRGVAGPRSTAAIDGYTSLVADWLTVAAASLEAAPIQISQHRVASQVLAVSISLHMHMPCIVDRHSLTSWTHAA